MVGPVSADRLLREAKWAVEIWHGATESARRGLAEQMLQVESAHLAALGADFRRYREQVRAELPDALMDYQRKTFGRWSDSRTTAWYQKPGRVIHPPLTEARRRAARRFRGDRVHQILAAQPLANIGEVYREFFEKLANERINVDRRRVYQAAGLLKQARELSRPVLLVLYRDRQNRGEYDSATKTLFSELVRYGSRDPAVKATTIIALPLDELPALSSLADVPVYETPRRVSPVTILTRSDGTHVETIAGPHDVRHLLARMRALLIEQRLTGTRQLMADGKFRYADRLLRQSMRLTRDETVRAKLRNNIADVYCHWAGQLAQSGRTTDALRRLRAVQNMKVEERYRRQAAGQMAKLAAKRSTVSADGREKALIDGSVLAGP